MANSIEEKYQSKTTREHVLSRSGLWIGSIDPVIESQWTINPNSTSLKPEFKEIEYVPGLIKIFDEVISNAIDHSNRPDTNVKNIWVSFDTNTGSITVKNDGLGIDVVVHKKEKVYVPEMLFSRYLSSSNYNDNENRKVGGTYGVGVKASVTWSTWCEVITVDNTRKLMFKQLYENNLENIHKPVITKCSKKPFTQVTFIPDYHRLKIKKKLHKTGNYGLMLRRVFEAAAVTSPNVKVYLNDSLLPIKDLQDFGKMFMPTDGNHIYYKINDDWEFFVADNDKGQFRQLSFVNGICVPEAGSHVNCVTNQITNAIKTVASKKKVLLKPDRIKAYLFLVLNCKITNPEFRSQTKDKLTTTMTKFKKYAIIPDKVLANITKKLNCLEYATAHETALIDKKISKTSIGTKTAKILGMPKLEDATWAGRKKSKECTLIVTEGDSAKTFAMQILSHIGRDFYGVFPLKGKPINAREKAKQQVLSNTEVQSLIQILGLKHNVDYATQPLSNLRYGSIMIMADQDTDGSHIKGLVINMFDVLFPSLAKLPGFLKHFITAVVRVEPKSKSKSKLKSFDFFSESSFKRWLADNEQSADKYSIRYYKGLGTNQPADAVRYCSHLSKHIYPFEWDDTKSAKSLELAFHPKQTDLRKQWLGQYNPDADIDYATEGSEISTFINKDLIHFSNDSNKRAIPCVVDGLKPVQRKILYTMLQKNINSLMKVGQLGPMVSEYTIYHHGEKSLCDAIIKMAQCFIGSSNNLPLLFPGGMFGSRVGLGKDSASERYTFTRLQKWTSLIFNPIDFRLVPEQESESKPIEPKFLVPIIPMILVNGAVGIGTGYSTLLPSYNPLELCDLLIQRLKHNDTTGIQEALEEIVPWYDGFEGTITKVSNSKYQISGKASITGDTTVTVTEIPISTSLEGYKAVLDKMIADTRGTGTGTIKKPIKSYDDNYTVVIEPYIIELIDNANNIFGSTESLLKNLKLTESVSTTNIHAFNEKSVIQKYDSIAEIFDYYYTIRLKFYKRRRTLLLNDLLREILIVDAKTVFIIAIAVEHTIDIRNLKKDLLIKAIEEHNIPKHPEHKDYKYLTDLPLMSLTKEKVAELKKKHDKLHAEFKILKKKSPEDLWLADLLELREFIKEYYKVPKRTREIMGLAKK